MSDYERQYTDIQATGMVNFGGGLLMGGPCNPLPLATSTATLPENPTICAKCANWAGPTLTAETWHRPCSKLPVVSIDLVSGERTYESLRVKNDGNCADFAEKKQVADCSRDNILNATPAQLKDIADFCVTSACLAPKKPFWRRWLGL